MAQRVCRHGIHPRGGILKRRLLPMAIHVVHTCHRPHFPDQPASRHQISTHRSGAVSPPPSPPTSALIVAERRHSAITRYAERSAACRDLTRPCCRRAGGTPLLQSRSMTARAVTPSVNPRQRRGLTEDADAPRSAADDALLLYIYSGAAMPLTSPPPLTTPTAID